MADGRTARKPRAMPARQGGHRAEAGRLRHVCAIAAMHLDFPYEKRTSDDMIGRRFGLAGQVYVVALVFAGGAQAQNAARDKAVDRVVLAPHRAVYDLVLDGSKPSGNIETAKGRIAFEFT